MSTFEDRQRQYAEVDEPAAKRKHIAMGIRRKFADQFDFGGLSDQEVIQRHYARFGQEMKPVEYGEKLEKVYGGGYVPPEPPKETLGERAQDLGEGVKSFAEGIVPFLVPEVPKVAAAVVPALKGAVKAATTKIPVVSQIGFLGGHAINVAVDTETAKALERTAAAIPVPNVDTLSQEYYDKLLPGLTAKGYSPEEIMMEARHRAQNVASGYARTTESIEQQVGDVQQQAAVAEPARAAADAFFLGVGAPMIEGILQKGLAKVGLAGAAGTVAKPATGAVGRLATHIKTGAVVGAPGMGIQGAISAGVQAAADNKTPHEIGQALVQGGITGVKHGAVGGALIGAGAGALEAGVGAVARPFVARARRKAFIEAEAQREVDDARLRGWQEFNANQRALIVKGEQDRRAAIQKTADSFNPHTTTFPLEGEPAEIATSIIQKNHGENAVLSEEGLRAATLIEERIRLYQDARNALEGNIEPVEMGPSQGRLPGVQPVGAPLETTGGIAPEPNLVPPDKAPVPPEPLPAPEGFMPGAGAVTQQEVPLQLEGVTPPEAAAPAVRLTQPLAVERFGQAPAAPEIAPRLGGEPVIPAPVAPAQPAVVPPPAPVPATTPVTAPEPSKPVTPVVPAAPVEPATPPAESPVVTPYAPEGSRAIELPTSAQDAIKNMGTLEHAAVEATPEGTIKITRLGKVSKPGGTPQDLDAIVKEADRSGVRVETDLVPPPGIRGGHIPLEKVIPWYEARGFKVVETTRIPEGNLATAKLVREPIGSHQTEVATALENAAAAARKRIASKTGRLSVGFDPTLVGDYAIELAADAFSKRLRNRDEIATWAVQKWGEDVRPFLDKIITLAQKHFARMFKETGTASKSLDELMALARSGEYGMGWYERTANWAKERYGQDADMFLRFLAVTSANGQTESGAAMAVKAFSQWKMGMPFEGFRGESMVGQLKKAAAGEKLGENTKIHNFLQALRGDPDAVVIDRWMMDALNMKDRGGALSPTNYRIYEQVVRSLARDNGMTPRQFQAAVWEGARVRSIQSKYERGGPALAAKTGSARPLEELVDRKLGGLTPEQYARDTEGHLQMMNNLYQSLKPVRTGIEKNKAGKWETVPDAPSGHTFDPETFEPAAHEGFVVSLVSNNPHRNHLYPGRVLKFRDDVQPLIAELKEKGLNPTIGVWRETVNEKPTGNFSLDLNVMVPDKAQALRLGKLARNYEIAELGPGGEWQQHLPTGYDPATHGKQFLPPKDWLKRDVWHKQQMNRARNFLRKSEEVPVQTSAAQRVNPTDKVMAAILTKKGRVVAPKDVPDTYGHPQAYWLAPDGKLHLVSSHEAVSSTIAKALRITEKKSGYKGMYRWDNHVMLQQGYIRLQVHQGRVTAQIVGPVTPSQRITMQALNRGRTVNGVISSPDGSSESKLYENLGELLRGSAKTEIKGDMTKELQKVVDESSFQLDEAAKGKKLKSDLRLLKQLPTPFRVALTQWEVVMNKAWEEVSTQPVPKNLKGVASMLDALPSSKRQEKAYNKILDAFRALPLDEQHRVIKTYAKANPGDPLLDELFTIFKEQE